jgi:hypothetical protein
MVFIPLMTARFCLIARWRAWKFTRFVNRRPMLARSESRRIVFSERKKKSGSLVSENRKGAQGNPRFDLEPACGCFVNFSPVRIASKPRVGYRAAPEIDVDFGVEFWERA